MIKHVIERSAKWMAGTVIPGAILGLAISTFAGISPADAKELHLIAPNIPPHFDDQGRGRIGDVIRAVLERCGHTVRFTMVPFGRHWNDYKKNESYDGLATAEADQVFPGFTTNPFIHLQDGATVIDGAGLEGIVKVEQLAGKRIVAFPNAHEILGIRHLLPKFKSFKQRTKRFDQIRPLLAGRVDVILADGLITAYFLQKLRDRAKAGQEPDVDATKPVKFRRIFSKGPQRLYFRDEAITKDFDRCSEELIASGEVDRIAKPYVDRYRVILGDQYPVR